MVLKNISLKTTSLGTFCLRVHFNKQVGRVSRAANIVSRVCDVLKKISSGRMALYKYVCDQLFDHVDLTRFILF